MGTTIPKGILGLRGQVVNTMTVESAGMLAVHCRRDARMRPGDSRMGQVGRANR